MQVADDDAPLAWALLHVVSVCAPSVSSVTSVASGSWMASGTPWGLPVRGDPELPTTNVADHGHDLDRLAIGVLLIPVAEEQSAREPGGCAMIRQEERGRVVGGLIWSFGQVGQLARHM